MTGDQLAATLARMTVGRIAIWRVLVDAEWNTVRRIFRGYAVSQDDSARPKTGASATSDSLSQTLGDGRNG